MRVAIVGGGITGLTAAYRLSQNGHQVTVFEKEKYLGGLAAGLKKPEWNWYLENYFHHLFVSDRSAKGLISELGLEDKLFYLRPKSSIFFNHKTSQFDSPLSLLAFLYLNPLEKVRTAVVTACLKLTNNWQSLEKVTAEKWLSKYYGQKTYQILWQPLLQSKFGNQAAKVSMAWFWARIKKRSTRLGYLKGGFQILINKLVEKIKENDGQIFLNQEIRDFKDLPKKFNKVIITTPTKITNMLGALNLILVLKKSFLTDGTYWLSINEPGFPFVAVVEQTNFIDKKHYGNNYILYIGGYYPQNHRYFKMTKEQILKEFLPHLKKINPNYNFQFSIFNFQLSSNLFAQPVIPTNYSKIIPKMRTSIPNLYPANMQMIYPWDRGINYAIEMGEKVANEIIKSN